MKQCYENLINLQNLWKDFIVCVMSFNSCKTWILCKDSQFFFGSPTRLSATYNWPCVKNGRSRCIPHAGRLCPWLLLHVIPNASQIGNCFLCIWKGNTSSSSTNGILGMRSCSYNSFNDTIMKCSNCISASIHMTVMRAKISNKHHTGMLLEVGQTLVSVSQQGEAILSYGTASPGS